MTLAEIEKLELICKQRLESMPGDLSECWECNQNPTTILALIKERKMMVDALKFYADKERFNDPNGYDSNLIGSWMCKGKRARNVLKEIGEI